METKRPNRLWYTRTGQTRVSYATWEIMFLIAYLPCLFALLRLNPMQRLWPITMDHLVGGITIGLAAAVSIIIGFYQIKQFWGSKGRFYHEDRRHEYWVYWRKYMRITMALRVSLLAIAAAHCFFVARLWLHFSGLMTLSAIIVGARPAYWFLVGPAYCFLLVPVKRFFFGQNRYWHYKDGVLAFATSWAQIMNETDDIRKPIICIPLGGIFRRTWVKNAPGWHFERKTFGDNKCYLVDRDGVRLPIWFGDHGRQITLNMWRLVGSCIHVNFRHGQKYNGAFALELLQSPSFDVWFNKTIDDLNKAQFDAEQKTKMEVASRNSAERDARNQKRRWGEALCGVIV